MTIQTAIETHIGDDIEGKYPLYLEPSEIEIVVSCLQCEKSRREASGEWTGDYEDPRFNQCMYLDDTIRKATALMNVIKAEEEERKSVMNYVLMYQKELPF